MSEVKPYAVGICFMSVCAPWDTPVGDVEAAANRQHPTGLDHGWQKADQDFRTGQTNPCDCNSDPERRHWLLEC